MNIHTVWVVSLEPKLDLTGLGLQQIIEAYYRQ
jgi:hypothetical protein